MKPKSFLFPLVLIVISLKSFGQLGIEYDLKKPQKYENRKLGYEKTTETKFKVPRHFIQNTVTHYNYYFNANVKINEVVAGAKSRHVDDYSQLLSFYNFSLDATSGFSRDLDSVIYKCNMGILIHDLRNDWVDNLYILMGRAYYYKKMMDSAFVIFQFTNFAFAPKEDDGYPKYIASNANREEGGNAFIVSTDEKRNFFRRTFSMPPSRNESLIWQIKTNIARNQFDKAAALIEVLKIDPQFPQRLGPDLEETQALLFYNQRMWDSSAFHLIKALPKADDRQDHARWEYLIGQLYDRAKKPELSKFYFEKAAQDTYNPILEVNARLNAIIQNRTGVTEKDDFIQKNIEALNKLARKEIYADYRDIIYFAAAQMELQRKAVPASVNYLLMSAKNAQPGTAIKNRAFVQLGELAFNAKKYKQAKSYYDSVNTQDPDIIGDPHLWAGKKAALEKIVVQLNIIHKQDSLLAIADMPAAERTAYIKKLVKQIRKQQGLAEEEFPNSANQPFNLNNKSAPNLFAPDAASAEWYFNNTSLKAKGFTEFKSVWGNRPNVDNWFLTSAMSRQGLNLGRPGQGVVAGETGAADVLHDNNITSEGLLANIPLTQEKRSKALDSIEKAYFALGKNYQNEIPDYPYAINAYDSLLVKFPDSKLTEETYYNIYVCYKMLGDNENATRIFNIMKQRFASGKYLPMILDPDAINKSENNVFIHATRDYNKIYDDFIEGNFDEALGQKRISDSLYGSKYWTPQLLYIESIYFIHERRDAEAATELNNIVKKFPNTGMAAKAKNLLEVLSRRQQIEDYLTNLQLIKLPEDTIETAAKPSRQRDSTQGADTGAVTNAKASKLAAKVDQNQRAGIGNPADKKLNMVAPVTVVAVDPAKLALLQRRSDSLQLAMQKAKNDADKLAYLKFQQDSIQTVLNKMRADSAKAAAARVSTLNSPFTFAPEQPHHVAIIMNKVDPVYISEARNAFNRFNKEEYYGKNLQVLNATLDDSIKLVLIEGFENSADALSYLEKARKLAPSDILPWLPVTKYNFIVITEQNLVILTLNKDLENYKKFLSVYFPGKF